VIVADENMQKMMLARWIYVFSILSTGGTSSSSSADTQHI